MTGEQGNNISEQDNISAGSPQCAKIKKTSEHKLKEKKPFFVEKWI